MRRRVLGMEIKLDGKYSEKEEKGEGDPGAHSGPFGYEKNSPRSQEDGEENPSLRKKRKVKMARIDTDGISNEDRNERKAKNSIHLRLKEINFFSGLLVILEPPSTAESVRPLRRPG
jgi:hypothetical protein